MVFLVGSAARQTAVAGAFARSVRSLWRYHECGGKAASNRRAG